MEHRLELGGFAVCNLIPNEPYKELLVPHEINLRRHVDKSVFVRVYCRVQSPVAGISVREHFEVNVCPIAVRLTHRFYHYLMSFFFTRKFERLDQTDGMEFEIGAKGWYDFSKICWYLYASLMMYLLTEVACRDSLCVTNQRAAESGEQHLPSRKS